MNDLNRATSGCSIASRKRAVDDMESVILGGGRVPFDALSLTSITSSAFSSVRSHSTLIESEGELSLGSTRSPFFSRVGVGVTK